jgi:hypothetical protein
VVGEDSRWKSLANILTSSAVPDSDLPIQYGANFCIYNDVVLLGPGDQIEIYGYPREVFPPADFHTATLVGDRIILVGGLGYPHDRRPGHTPVYVLDLSGYPISEMATSGDLPGWIFEHEAAFHPIGIITIRGGEIIEESEGKQRRRRNGDVFALNLSTGVWLRLTDRKWRQFAIRQENFGPSDVTRFINLFLVPEALVPRSLADAVEPTEGPLRFRIMVGGKPISLVMAVMEIKIVIKCDLPRELALQFAEEVRCNAEALHPRRCLLTQVQ